jgi:hypothetical protein
MAIKVGATRRNLKVGAVKSAQKVSVSSRNVGSQKTTNAELQNLANVNTSVNGLEDGFTLVYDEDTDQWVAERLSAAVDLDVLDGGTY